METTLDDLTFGRKQCGGRVADAAGHAVWHKDLAAQAHIGWGAACERCTNTAARRWRPICWMWRSRRTGRGGRRYRWSLSIAAVLVAVVPALTYANVILNHFYLQGAYFWDTGVVAGAIWRRDAWLTYPPLWPIGSLYAYHVMPLLSLLTVASRCLPLGLPGWFALVTGVGHALPSIGVFWLLAEGLALRSAGDLAIAVVVAVGIGFTGIPLATILFPHPEIILAGGLILVFAAIALEHYRIAAALLVFTLLVREDAGFHVVGVLFLLGAINWLRGISWQAQRPILILAAVGFLYSVAATAFKLVVFPGQPSLFVLDYIGNPPFSNTSIQQVLLHLIGLPIYRAYVFWPAVVAVACGAITKCIDCPWILGVLPLVAAASHGEPGHTSHSVGVLFVSIPRGMCLASGRCHHRREAAWRARRRPPDVGMVQYHAGRVVCGAVESLESRTHGSLEEPHDPAVSRAGTRYRPGRAGIAWRGGGWCGFPFRDDLHGPERLFVSTVFVRRRDRGSAD
jgi:hypothetical protein